MRNLPKARTADILEMEADDELMIYDLRINKAYNLNETSKTVYLACDGKTSFDELKRQFKFTDDLIHLTLGELQKNDLLATQYASPFAGLNRREVIKKVGLASMIALPVITGLVAPIGAQSASCTQDGQPAAISPVSNTNGFVCVIGGYPDASCCAGFATGTFDGGTLTCTNLVCGRRPD